MPDYLSVFTGGLISDIHNSYIAKEIASLNKLTEDYGLTLSQEDCREIAETRRKSFPRPKGSRSVQAPSEK